MQWNFYCFIRRKEYIMRSKVTNENTWETKWSTESSQGGRGVRRAARKTESSGLKLSKPSRGNTARERTLRRLESNERERMRMHSLNDAFQVCEYKIKCYYILIKQNSHIKWYRKLLIEVGKSGRHPFSSSFLSVIFLEKPVIQKIYTYINLI